MELNYENILLLEVDNQIFYQQGDDIHEATKRLREYLQTEGEKKETMDCKSDDWMGPRC